MTVVCLCNAHILGRKTIEYKGINLLLLYKWQSGGGVEQSAAAAATAPNRPLLLRLIDFVNNCSCHFPPQDNCVCAQISLLTFLSQHFVQALKFDLNKHKSANNTKRQMTVSLILSKTILTLLSPVKVTIFSLELFDVLGNRRCGEVDTQFAKNKT